jgi:hypothetical protein
MESRSVALYFVSRRDRLACGFAQLESLRDRCARFRQRLGYRSEVIVGSTMAHSLKPKFPQ